MGYAQPVDLILTIPSFFKLITMGLGWCFRKARDRLLSSAPTNTAFLRRILILWNFLTSAAGILLTF
jgi:hypothetical protein